MTRFSTGSVLLCVGAAWLLAGCHHKAKKPAPTPPEVTPSMPVQAPTTSPASQPVFTPRPEGGGMVWWKCQGLADRKVTALAARSDGRLYAAAGALFRSDNGGRTFQEIGLRGYYLRSIDVDSKGRIYATDWMDPSSDAQWGRGGVYRSNDDGAHWDRLSKDLPRVTRIVVDGQDLPWAISADKLYRFVEDTGNWQPALPQETSEIRCIALGQGGSILAATDATLYRLSNGGETVQHAPIPACVPCGIAEDPSGRLFVAGAAEGAMSVLCSADAGKAFTGIGPGSPAVDLTLGGGGRLFVATNKGVFRSDNGQAGWHVVLPAGNGGLPMHLAADAQGALFVALNFGGLGILCGVEKSPQP